MLYFHVQWPLFVAVNTNLLAPTDIVCPVRVSAYLHLYWSAKKIDRWKSKHWPFHAQPPVIFACNAALYGRHH